MPALTGGFFHYGVCLFLKYCNKRSQGKDNGVPMEKKGGNLMKVMNPKCGTSCPCEDPKKPSKDSIYRWMSLAAFIGFISLFFPILIVLVALPN